MTYLVVKTAAGTNNGGIRSQMPGEPPYWLVYFGAEDVEHAGGEGRGARRQTFWPARCRPVRERS